MSQIVDGVIMQARGSLTNNVPHNIPNTVSTGSVKIAKRKVKDFNISVTF
ncbi:MAG UNVERIFIED_CONTAM: hypothetical protein LVT10_11670 [Anaerolineae bacterium]|jgi:hypothetical protein